MNTEEKMQEIMFLCIRYAEMFNAENAIKRHAVNETTRVALTEMYLINKGLFEKQYELVEKIQNI